MVQADPQGPVPHLHAYQDAINRGAADAAAALFLAVARIEEEGVRYPSVRAVLDYLVGERAHIDLGDFHIRGQQVTCIYHEVSELDRVVGYPGSRRQADFTFSQNHIATLLIHRLDPQERQDAGRLIIPFFTWIKTTQLAEWARMSQLSYESQRPWPAWPAPGLRASHLHQAGSARDGIITDQQRDVCCTLSRFQEAATEGKRIAASRCVRKNDFT